MPSQPIAIAAIIVGVVCIVIGASLVDSGLKLQDAAREVDAEIDAAYASGFPERSPYCTREPTGPYEYTTSCENPYEGKGGPRILGGLMLALAGGAVTYYGAR